VAEEKTVEEAAKEKTAEEAEATASDSGGAAQGWQRSSRAVGRASSAMVAGSKRDGGGSRV